MEGALSHVSSLRTHVAEGDSHENDMSDPRSCEGSGGMEVDRLSEEGETETACCQSCAGQAVQAPQLEVARLTRQVDRLQLSLKYLDREEKRTSCLRGKCERDAPTETDAGPMSAPRIDVTLDRVVSSAESNNSDVPVEPRGPEGDTPNRLHELEGVMDVMLARVSVLDDDVKDIQSSGGAVRL